MTVTSKQLQSLAIYVPPPVSKWAYERPHQQPGGTWRRFHAVTAFADISGFTPLAETLAQIGGRGAEELTFILNQVFEALITAVEQHGGQVVKFGGDALSVIWPCDPDEMPHFAWRMLLAAFDMQSAMTLFSTVNTSQGEFQLRMKIGLSAGELLEVHAGGVFGRWEYVLAGGPMVNMSSAENHASAGEVVMDETLRQLLADTIVVDAPADTSLTSPYIQVETVGAGFYRVVGLENPLTPTSLERPDWQQLDASTTSKAAAIMRSYIPGAISSILESGHYDMLAELKPMTVCFVGFSGIDYDAHPDAGERLSHFARDAQEMIYHYEGSVNKLAIGDKGSMLLVLFGAPPFFHEDDEVRGIACALALVKVAERHGLELSVGLTAGPLFAGPLGAPLRREYSVIGDTVNLAARLMQKAPPGQVWVDHSVQSRARNFFEYEDLGFVPIKGKVEPRHLYHAVVEKEPDREAQVMSFLLSNQELTGRDKEIAIIDELAGRVWDNQGRVLLLSGEAGVGKSRLAAEIVRRWMARGGAYYGGDCVSYGRQTPYLPWRGILSSIAGLSPRLPTEERLARLERLLHRLPEAPTTTQLTSVTDSLDGTIPDAHDYWLERLPLLAEILGLETPDTDLTRSLSDDLRRDNVFATIQAVVIAEAARRPILVMLEDTHWSDELSLELAAHLSASIVDLPILLVLVHRPLGHPEPMPYQRLRGLRYATDIYVNELDPESGVKLAQGKLGVKHIPPALSELVRRKGQGNPFFIEELLNSLLSMGVLTVQNGECVINGHLDRLEMPDTVQKVVLARIDRLPEADKITLKVAATIGRTFQRDLLEAVHPWTATQLDLDEQLARLQAEDFTRQEVRESDLDFLFKHVITQEVAYETMLYSQRRQLHTVIGQVIEAKYSTSSAEVLDLLAYHYARSDNHDKALLYMQQAGQRALDGYANDSAVNYFSEALRIAHTTKNVKVQYDLLAGRERAYNRIGNRAAQQTDLDQMKKLTFLDGVAHVSRQLEVGTRQVQLATNLGHYDDAIAAAYETLGLAQEAQHFDWAARILTNMGIIYWRQGDYQAARDVMQQALDSKDNENAAELKAISLNYLGLIYSQISEFEQSRHSYQQAMSLYQSIGDRGGEAGCANNLGLLEASLGRYPQAQQAYIQALSICRTIGDRQREGISLNTLGQVNTILGHYHPARDQLDMSLSIRQAIGDRRGEAFCLHDIGYLNLAEGNTSAAITAFQQACDIRQELGETGNYVASLAALGEALLAANQADRAYESLRDSLKYLRNGAHSGEYPRQNVWWVYAQICQTLGYHDEARQALQNAYELVEAKSSRITEPELRRSYRASIRANAAIIAAAEAAGLTPAQ